MPTVAIQSGVPNVVTTPSNEAAAKPVRRAIWLSPFGLLLPQEQPLVSLRRQPRPPSPPSQGFGADRRRQPARDCPCRVAETVTESVTKACRFVHMSAFRATAHLD